MGVPLKPNTCGPKLRYEKDLAGVGIFYFRTWRITFHVNFTCIWRVRTDYTSGLTWYLGCNRVIFGLRRRDRRGRRKSFRRRSFLRCRLRCIFGHSAYWRGWARDGTVAVTIPRASCLRSFCCLTSNQRHTKRDRNQKDEVTNHSEMYRSALIHPSSNDNRNPGRNPVPVRQFPPAWLRRNWINKRRRSQTSYASSSF